MGALKEKLIVVIMAHDSHTPGVDAAGRFTNLCDTLGIKDISTWHRYSYLAVIDGGKVACEVFDNADEVRTEYEAGDIKIIAESRGLIRGSAFARVFVGDTQKAVNLRGLNFVVFDKASGKVADSVNFDTFADTCDCRRFKSLVSYAPDLLRATPNYTINNRFNHGDLRANVMLKTFVFALQLYHWLPKENKPFRHEPNAFWQSVPLRNNNYANAMWSQAAILNHYKAVGEIPALQLVARIRRKWTVSVQKRYIQKSFSLTMTATPLNILPANTLALLRQRAKR